MEQNQKLIYTILITTLVLVTAVIGYWYAIKQDEMENKTKQTNEKTQEMMKESKSDSEKNQMMKDETNDSSKNNNSNYTGKVLAGSTDTIPYLDFNKEDYEQAKNEGKTIYLEFYANWCPICRAQEPDLLKGFNEYSENKESTNIVAFRVNYKDNETDDFEKSLAEKYKVTYQHTKVIIKDDEVVLNKNEVWNEQKLKNNLDSI